MTSTSAANEDSPAFVENEELAGAVGEQDDYLGAICRCDVRHIPATGHESPPFPIEFGPQDSIGIDLILYSGCSWLFQKRITSRSLQLIRG